jgi:predicted acylesterase/phospholipase RssA
MNYRPRFLSKSQYEVLVLLLVFAISGCGSVPERTPPPAELKELAEIPGFPHVRDWGDDSSFIEEYWMSPSDEEIASNYSGVIGSEHTYLAISGGGANGAYGAGLLVGWTAAGTRPEFTVVTGISTGALIAPFAFLGSDYDEMLRELYTTLSTDDLIKKRGILTAITSDAVASTEPLQAKIAQYVDQRVVDAIAAEFRRGRHLIIGTTDLDTGRPVDWYIGEIANSDNPNRIDLIHKVLLASASIPGVFPPVLIGAEYEGQHFDEMHVDGGVVTQAFFYSFTTDWNIISERLEVKGRPTMYMIRNSRVNPARTTIEPTLLSITERSISLLILNQGVGDIFYMASLAERDDIDLNLAYIPDDFEIEENELFDPVYMQALFDLGYHNAKEGNPWLNVLNEINKY